MSDESRTLRGRHSALAAEADRLPTPAPAGGSTMLVRTGNEAMAYPTTAGVFYACVPVDPGGPEVEGGAGTFTDGAGLVFVLNAGAGVPPTGTKVIARAIGGRWVMTY